MPTSHNVPPDQPGDRERLDEMLRKALATPPISNEEIVRRSKETRPSK